MNTNNTKVGNEINDSQNIRLWSLMASILIEFALKLVQLRALSISITESHAHTIQRATYGN